MDPQNLHEQIEKIKSLNEKINLSKVNPFKGKRRKNLIENAFLEASTFDGYEITFEIGFTSAPKRIFLEVMKTTHPNHRVHTGYFYEGYDPVTRTLFLEDKSAKTTWVPLVKKFKVTGELDKRQQFAELRVAFDMDEKQRIKGHVGEYFATIGKPKPLDYVRKHVLPNVDKDEQEAILKKISGVVAAAAKKNADASGIFKGMDSRLAKYGLEVNEPEISPDTKLAFVVQFNQEVDKMAENVDHTFVGFVDKGGIHVQNADSKKYYILEVPGLTKADEIPANKAIHAEPFLSDKTGRSKTKIALPGNKPLEATFTNIKPVRQ